MAQPPDIAPGLLQKLAALLILPRQGAQGVHVDPDLTPAPDPATWSADQREAWFAPQMQTLREAIALDGLSLRDSVLAELAAFHGEDPARSYEKCLNWEALSVEEWKAGDRTTEAGVRDFYETTTSWRYDLAWYAYLQATGHAFPQAVALARFLRARKISGELLDFGSGIGLNGQVLHRLGYPATLADISTPLLDYAKWRCARRGDAVGAINLNHQSLPAAAFDVVTAFDVLVHVTDFDATVRDLHRALRPGGWLFANFDTRAKDDGSSWHLQDNAVDLDRRLKAAGFVRRHVIGGFLDCYQRVEPATLAHRLRSARERALVPARLTASLARRVRWPTPRRLAKLAMLPARLAARRRLAPPLS